MSDIDFDELDKAVNTLMGDVPKAAPSKTDDIKTLTINSTLPDDAPPSLAKLDSTLAAVNGLAVKPADRSAEPAPVRTSMPSLAMRRGGRFMDVVHPSSNMKTATKPVVPSSRQGVTIEPAGEISSKTDDQSEVIKTDIITPDSYKNLTVSDVAPQSEAAQSADRPASTNDWPDPLEMSGYEPDATVTEETIVAQDIITPVSKDAELTLSTTDGLEFEDPQPLNSPFITDAKVEKRPLGGQPVEEPSHAPVLGVLATDDAITGAVDPTDQLPATPGHVEAQLPPELQSDLMAIETDGGTSASQAHTPVSVPATVDTSSQVESRDAPVAVEAKPLVAVPAASVGPTSIPQQYHEEPSTSDESNGSIYDTDSYHQPLAHPAKTKSGWLWVIWILLLLIVGGGGAVALYFVGII